MNSLSWLLYIAGVSHGLSIFLGVMGGIGLIFGAISCLYFLVEKETLAPRKFFIVPVIGFVLMCMSILIPSEKTIMYIAASEYGEKVIQSKEVKDIANPAIDLLKQWMKKESAKLNKE